MTNEAIITKSSAITAALSSFLAPRATVETKTDAKASSNVASNSATRTGSKTATPVLMFVSETARRLDSQFLAQAEQAKRMAKQDAPTNVMIDITHSHYCKHCDRSYTCKSNPCLINGYDISKLHKCNEAKVYRKRMVIMLSAGDKPKCKYNCDRECYHPGKIII